MRASRLSARVAWSVWPVARWRKVARFLPGLALVALELASGGSDTLTRPEPIDPRVPADPKDRLEQPLGTVKVSGRGAGLPDAYPSPQDAWVYSDRAVIRPGLHDVTLPLAELTVTQAQRIAIPWTKRKAADAIWRVRAVGPDAEVEFRGHWVLLAQLGTWAVGRSLTSSPRLSRRPDTPDQSPSSAAIRNSLSPLHMEPPPRNPYG